MKTFLREFWLFGLKQAWACLFGGLFLALIIGTKYYYPLESIHRYDFLFLGALAIQAGLLIFKLETWKEAKVIFLFHLVGTAMEIFKTHPDIGSWSYPEASLFHIGNVPLFTGFMYSAVGSYIARCWNIFKFEFSHYPNPKYLIAISLAIYINFFLHHFWYDVRWILFILVGLIFYKTWIYFTMIKTPRRMPLLVGFLLVAFFIWIAENIGTFTQTWVYPEQTSHWDLVKWQKLGSWYLLMIISFVMVTWIHKPKLKN